jgi:alcohol dehydrogenase (cytochrome c)
MLAGVTATSGGVLFTGVGTGDFLVLESASGRELFRFHVGSPVAGGVVTYRIQKKQYVAIVAGHIGAFNLFAPEIGGGSPTVVIFSLPLGPARALRPRRRIRRSRRRVPTRRGLTSG